MIKFKGSIPEQEGLVKVLLREDSAAFNEDIQQGIYMEPMIKLL